MSVEKRALHLVGFPTPDEATDTPSYLLFLLPDELWAQYVLGALEPLTYEENWYEAGAMLPEEASEAFRLIVQQAPYNFREPSVPTPYWDEAQDVDDEQSILEQVWYGNWVEGEFVESIGTFAIAGFLALAGTPAAAVAFLTVAPKFRLAWRTGDLGGIVRVVVDSADMGTVDTYSVTEGTIEKDFYGDPEAETHQIYQILESIP